MDLRKLLTNAGLAGFAAFAGAIAASQDVTVSVVIAAVYAGVRGAAGFIASGIGHPVSVDHDE